MIACESRPLTESMHLLVLWRCCCYQSRVCGITHASFKLPMPAVKPPAWVRCSVASVCMYKRLHSKRKMAWAINAKLGTLILYSSRSACIDRLRGQKVGSRSHGYENHHGHTVASDTCCCGCCRRVSACRCDCLCCFLVIIGDVVMTVGIVCMMEACWLPHGLYKNYSVSLQEWFVAALCRAMPTSVWGAADWKRCGISYCLESGHPFCCFVLLGFNHR